MVDGIRNITKNNKLPIEPKINSKFENINMPTKPPEDFIGKDWPAM